MARKILLADDSVTAQNMGRKILTDAGYDVVTVNNGSAALKKMAEGKPDLIVLDVYMPGYSGLEVCQRIKENRETARIPVLLTVGKLEPFKPEEARRAHADAFVVKPFEASELLAALTKLEDKIIPQPEPYKQGRFAKAIASVEQDAEDSKFGDSDDGWKARLRIPSGPPKPRDADPGPDYAATQDKGFRDFLEKSSTRDKPMPAPKNGDFERPLPIGVPHDITPEEIAAITAAAARLSGEPVVEKTPATSDTRAEALNAETNEETAPVTFASSPSTSAQVPEALASAAHDESPVETEVEANVGIPSEIAESAPTVPAASVEATSETPLPLVEDSPLRDEPQAQVHEFDAGPIAPPAPEATTGAAIAEISAELPTLESTVGAASIVEPVAAGQPAPVHDMPTPTIADEEVMAALQTLIPSSTGDSSIAQLPSEPTSPAPGESSGTADVSSRWAHSARPRWIAEEVPITAEEAILSLEREMENVPAAQTAAPAALDVPPASSEPGSAAPRPTSEIPEPPAPQSADPAEPCAMASAAAGGESASVSWAAASNISTAHERPVLEGPAGLAENAQIATAAVAPVADNHNELVGGTEIMAANWKNIRESIAGAAAKPAASKEEFQEAGSAKAEPEAATVADKTSSPSPAADPTAIANIVESVMAELRPKIVEEIARKLSHPKKGG